MSDDNLSNVDLFVDNVLGLILDYSFQVKMQKAQKLIKTVTKDKNSHKERS